VLAGLILICLCAANVFGQVASATPSVTPTPTIPAELSAAFGCYDGDGEFTQPIALGFETAVVFVGKKDTAAAHDIWWSSDAMTSGYSCQVYYATGFLCQQYYITLSGTGFTAGSNINALGSTYCYYAFAKASRLLVTGVYTGNGSNPRTITNIGLDPDLVIDQRFVTNTGASTLKMRFRTVDMPSGRSCGLSATLSGGDCPNNYITELVSDGFTVNSTYLNATDKLYTYVAAKKNSNVSRWLWTAAYTGEFAAPLRSINLDGQARMAMISSAGNSDCAGMRHDQDDLSTNQYIQLADTGDLEDGITMGDPNGISVDGTCNLEFVDYYAWGLYEPSHTPVNTLTQTPTVTQTPTNTYTSTLIPTNTPTPTITPVGEDVCCDGGPAVNCVNAADYGQGYECPAWFTPKPGCVCNQVQ